MATCREIVTRALRRIRETGAGETPSSEDAALGLELLNGIVERWPSKGIEPYFTALSLNDTFSFFVPPLDATAEVVSVLSYRGTWDASANSPALASSTGTKGYFYKVATAGSTTLDDVTSWAVGDYAVFDGLDWLKSRPVVGFERAIIDMLALELTHEYGHEPSALLARQASSGWRSIQAAYIKAPLAQYDKAAMWTIQRSGVELGNEEN